MNTLTRKVFITGGTGSVGQALVEVFAKAGYHVTFQYLSSDREARNLESAHGAHSVQVDLSRVPIDLPDEPFDIIVNNAGINISDALTHDTAIADWTQTLTINLTAPFMLSRFYLPGMITRQWGRIINISSIYGLRATERNLPYTVSKHGLQGLTKTIAKEYAHLGITCNEICPAAIDSRLLDDIAQRYSKVDGSSTADFIREVTEGIPDCWHP